MEEIAAREAEAARVAQQQARDAERVRRQESLDAMRAFQKSLSAQYVPELPYAGSLARSGPLSDMRMVSGIPEVETGTRRSIHDLPIPFRGNPSTRAELAESMAEPFLQSGFLQPRSRPMDYYMKNSRIPGRFGYELMGPSRVRNAEPWEVRQVDEAFRDIYPEYHSRYVEMPENVSTRGLDEARSESPIIGVRQAFPFASMQSPWNYRASGPINNLLDREITKRISQEVGRPGYYVPEVDVATLRMMLDAISGGNVSSAMHPQGLEFLLREGVAPSAFRVNQTGANPQGFAGDYANMRRAAEYGNFGLPIDAPVGARPYYGFIDAPESLRQFEGADVFSDRSAGSYGPIIANWAPSVRDRSTYTIGDSLNMIKDRNFSGLIPRPLSNTSLQDVAFASGGYNLDNNIYNPGYAEVQMFGGPNINELLSLRVAENYADRVRSILSRYGLDIPVEPSGVQRWEAPR